MSKKTYKLMIAVIFSMGCFTFPSITIAAFTDVSADNINAEAINYVQQNGIVKGYDDGTYRSHVLINRAEFTKIIVEAVFDDNTINNCITDNVEATNEAVFFPDVPKSAWFSKYVCVAKVNNIIKGYPDGTYRPSGNINFVEASKIIVIGFGYQTGSDAIWYRPFVELLGNKNSIPVTVTSLESNVNRGEMAEIIYRLKANITDKSSLTYTQLSTGSEAPIAPPPVNVVPFNTNGDLISGWYWLRDQSLSHYAEWSFTDIPSSPDGITIDWYVLATSTYSGSRGFPADFVLYYGSSKESDLQSVNVHLPNVSTADDPVGYNCKGSVNLPASALSGGSTLYLKVLRKNASDNHVAVNKDSVVSIKASTTEKMSSTFDTNGNLISGWYWIRDKALQQYAEWNFTNVSASGDELTVDLYVLATNNYNGGKGFSADFVLFYGPVKENSLTSVNVHLPNVSTPDDPVGYNCKGTVKIPASALNGGTSLYLRAVRINTTDNHIAVNKDSVISIK